MGELDHHLAVMLMAIIGQPLKPRDNLVLVGMQVAKRRRAVLCHQGRPGRHGHRDPALGLLQMIEPISVLGHPVLGIGRLVRSRHDPVLQRQMLELIGLQQGIIWHRYSPRHALRS